MEQFGILNLTNHHKKTIDGFCSLRKNEEFCDIKIICEEKVFLAHKMILSVHSEYFASLLNVISCPCPLIVFREFSATQMAQIMEFIYEGKIRIPQADVKKFIDATDYLQIKGCKLLKSIVKDAEPSSSEIENDDVHLFPSIAGSGDDPFMNPISEPEMCLEIGESITTDPLLQSLTVSAPSSKKYCKVIKSGRGKKSTSNASRNSYTVVCPYCEKRFKNRSHIAEHLRSHTGEKPFTCDLCSRTFRHSRSFTRHRNEKRCFSTGKRRKRNVSKTSSIEVKEETEKKESNDRNLKKTQNSTNSEKAGQDTSHSLSEAKCLPLNT